jgi:hypothetical protein
MLRNGAGAKRVLGQSKLFDFLVKPCLGFAQKAQLSPTSRQLDFEDLLLRTDCRVRWCVIAIGLILDVVEEQLVTHTCW